MQEPLRDFLNRHRWKDADVELLLLVVRHRGGENDEREVPGTAIVEIQPGGLLIENRYDADLTAFIPYHRVLRVLRMGEVLWTQPPAP